MTFDLCCLHCPRGNLKSGYTQDLDGKYFPKIRFRSFRARDFFYFIASGLILSMGIFAWKRVTPIC